MSKCARAGTSPRPGTWLLSWNLPLDEVILYLSFASSERILMFKTWLLVKLTLLYALSAMVIAGLI